MTRRIALLLSATLVAVAFAGASQSAFAAGPQGSLCQLAGKATFTNGLTGTPQATSYRFAGKLTNCQSNASKYTRAKITAKGSSSSESCEGGTSKGVATVYWSRTVTSVVKFTTTGVGALVDVAGTIVKGLGKGSTVHGDLAFQADPQQCASGGVTTASFNGTTEYGTAG